MPNIIGVRFKSCGKIYDFEINGFEVRKGDRVIIESELGLSIGNVAVVACFVERHSKELKKVLRLATEDDLRQKEENEKFEKEARSFCYERVMARGLPMKLVCSEVSLDRKRIIFYFTADGRIDFRELVKDLASRFKTRIEMRQIGVRDKARLTGGLGICGKELCCRLFLASFEPISIKMAKQQDLSLNTGKLSGACGRLMCCLGYEYNENESAADYRKAMEKVARIDNSEAADEGDRLLDAVSPESACCPADEKAENLPAASGKTAGPQQEAVKRRRRRRRRKKKGPKTDE